MSLNFDECPIESEDFDTYRLPSLRTVKKRIAAGEQPDIEDLEIALYSQYTDIYEYLSCVMEQIIPNSWIRSKISELDELARECDCCVDTAWLEKEIDWNNKRWYGEHEGAAEWNEAVKNRGKDLSDEEVKKLVTQANKLDNLRSDAARKKAGELYRLAALHGNPEAMFKYPRWGRAKGALGDFLMVEAAKRGYAPAQTDLGFSLSLNDEKEAVMWLRKAAEQNDPKAFKWLAHLYEHGECGLRKSPGKAKEFRLKALQNETDDADTLRWMAEIYKKGDKSLHIQPSPEKSIRCLMRINDPLDVFEIDVAKAFLSGWGVKKSKEKAVAWLKKAVKKSSSDEILTQVMDIYKSLGMEKEYFQTAKKGLAEWIHERNQAKKDYLFVWHFYHGDEEKMNAIIAQKIKFYQDLIAQGKMN